MVDPKPWTKHMNQSSIVEEMVRERDVRNVAKPFIIRLITLFL